MTEELLKKITVKSNTVQTQTQFVLWERWHAACFVTCQHHVLDMAPKLGFAKTRPTAQGTLHGPAARFTVHITGCSLEFLSAVFYSACSDLGSKMEEETTEIAKKPKLTFFHFEQDQNMRCKISLTKILNWTAGCELWSGLPGHGWRSVPWAMGHKPWPVKCTLSRELWVAGPLGCGPAFNKTPPKLITTWR